jgi:hypothetical protein
MKDLFNIEKIKNELLKVGRLKEQKNNNQDSPINEFISRSYRLQHLLMAEEKPELNDRINFSLELADDQLQTLNQKDLETHLEKIPFIAIQIFEEAQAQTGKFYVGLNQFMQHTYDLRLDDEIQATCNSGELATYESLKKAKELNEPTFNSQLQHSKLYVQSQKMQGKAVPESLELGLLQLERK